MKNILPVLALLAGLGSSISFAQVKQEINPFDRYMNSIKAHRLMCFAAKCGLERYDVTNVSFQKYNGATNELQIISVKSGKYATQK
jgi:hypothetical protein